MYGVSGIINLNFKPVCFQVLKAMSDAQKHRGPDDQGFVGFSFQQNKVQTVEPDFLSEEKQFHAGFGFNRLSILDLSKNGHQPMISADKKTIIAYNGEIYNAFDFKPFLEKKGYRFNSTTDTEIVLNLYREFGIQKLLDLANGMFGFALADLHQKKVFLARDHVGIKPMYWCKLKNTILFASEIKAFLFHPDFKAEMNRDNFDEYTYYKYNAFDRTLFKHVKQIPAGYYLEISAEGETLKKYWEPDFTQQNTNKKIALLNLEETIKKSVKSQLISDVKVGCQLSGGIDSSLVTTFARNHFEANMDTFSVILENERFSEEKYIDQVIEKTKPLSHKFELDAEYFAKNMISSTWHLDVPLPIPQTIGLKKLAEGASNFVTVLLSGEGSDELMGGYFQHYNQAFKSRNKWTISLLSKIPGKGQKIKNQYLPQIPAAEYFIAYRAALALHEFKEFRPDVNLNKIYEQRKQLLPKHPNHLVQARYYDMKTWLVNILNMQDKMTMAHSIENRVPFLDKHLINLVNSLPVNYFVKSGKNPLKYNSPNKNTKILLKKVAKKYYSHDFVYRTKVGFNQPINDYFRHPLMQEMIHEMILPGIKTRGMYDYKIIKSSWEDFNKLPFHKNIYLLWTVFSFEFWAQVFIDNKFAYY